MFLIKLIIFIISFDGGHAKPFENTSICHQIMHDIAKKTKVPYPILSAIALTESGYGGKPWPWTLNVKGRGYYFPSKQKAINFIKKLPKRLHPYIDIGCMQLNFRYHGHKFKNIYEILNIDKNMYIAAQYLKYLYKKEKLYRLRSEDILSEKLVWSNAIGDYHSKKNKPGLLYTARVAKNAPKGYIFIPKNPFIASIQFDTAQDQETPGYILAEQFENYYH